MGVGAGKFWGLQTCPKKTPRKMPSKKCWRSFSNQSTSSTIFAQSSTKLAQISQRNMTSKKTKTSAS